MDNYIKAAPLRDAKAFVYARQFTKRNCYFEPTFDEFGGEIHFLEINGQIFYITPDDWLVWFPKSREFTFMRDDEFRKIYTLYDDMPVNVRLLADNIPSYKEWVRDCNRIMDADNDR